ncbi:MAG: FecR domain-containing protein [Bacteroidota bacterium]
MAQKEPIYNINELAAKYRAGSITPTEKAYYERWWRSFDDAEAMSSADDSQDLQSRMFARLDERINPPMPKVYSLRRRIAVAASILFILSIGGYFILNKEPVQLTAANTEQLAPVQNGVTLTLASGKKMVLSKKHNGQIANINGTQINQQDSLLSYQGKAIAEEVKMNTLTNNGSSKFSVTLSDGTVATLDIGSSLTYPVAFNGNTRSVSMTGQAYFKVKHLSGQRFIVKAKNQTTEDIGTEFNINAYDDEDVVKTTLVEGSIKVNERFLNPGEQAIINGSEIAVKKANIEEVTAWLQGQLYFHKEKLENILREVARIYNVTIVWHDQDLRKLTFGGGVTRGEKLSTILNYFRKAGGVDFKVEGKTVTVFKPKSK